MTRYTFEEVRAIGARGDALERALAKLVESLLRHSGVQFEAARRAIEKGEPTFAGELLEAIAVLKTMKLETTRDMLRRCGLEVDQ